MDITIKIEGIEEFTESMALLASAIAYDKGMKLTGQAANALISETKEEHSVTKTADKVTKTEEKEADNDVSLETEDSKITIEDVRAAFMAKNSKSNTSKLKKILNDFGVKKVTDLKEKDFPAVLEALEAI